MPIRLCLFGPPGLVQHEGSVALTFERRSQLLAHLALRRGAVPRTELSALLWPQAPLDQAHANLRTTVFRLRTLPWAAAIAVQDHALAFVGETDVADFEAAYAQRRWADAVQIGGDTLLAGYDDDANESWSLWLRAERDRLRAAWRIAANQCLAVAGDAAEALALSARLLADDSLDESALRALMLAYAQQGHPARARAAYRDYAARLASELGAVPSAELQALHEALAGSDGTAILPAPGGEQRLIGRSAERRTVLARLADGCLLLSLIGPGGVGKSCLARHLLSELAPQYADGAVYVPLDDVASPDALGARLARELSVPGGDDPLQAVITFLRARRMLLVLDNFEHLQPAASQLQTLLDHCPRVQMLVTSRVRLGLSCEHLLPLDGLPCPEAEDADCLEAFDAARLFVRAAQVVDPGLQPAAESAAIVEICSLVDGLPLALEIAAAWTRMLSCATIAAELRKGFELLTEPDTARPARHASMAAVFEQSWQRLSAAEREAWSRLTVFHGGFTFGAARKVTGAALPVLAALADQSLLRKTAERADMHPLLRQLAAGRLAETEREANSQAHATYYLGWLTPLLDGLARGDKQVLQQVELEFENVRAAWRWACRHGPATALQSAVLPVMRFCESSARHPEGLALLREAAAGIGAGDARLAPLLDVAAAHLHCRTERYAEGEALAKRALLASRAARDHDTRLHCYRVLGNAAHKLGRMRTALRRYRQALALAPPAIDPHNAAVILHNQANIEFDLGHIDVARTLITQALVEQRRIRNVYGEAVGLNNLAWFEMGADRIDVAAAHLEACLALSERHALTNIKMMALENLTEIAVRRNDAAAVRRHGARAYELAGQIGARGVQSSLQVHFAQIALQQRNLAAAREALRAAVGHAITIDQVPLRLDCIVCCACLLWAQGEPRAAVRLLRYVIDHPATAAVSRNRARGRLTEWSAIRPDAASLSAPTVDLWTLLHRIVDEALTAHADLIESLGAP